MQANAHKSATVDEADGEELPCYCSVSSIEVGAYHHHFDTTAIAAIWIRNIST